MKFLIRHILDNYPDNLAFLDKRIKDEEKNMKQDDRRPMGLVDMLRFVVDNDFERITYTEAVDILRNSNTYKKGKFKFDVQWGKGTPERARTLPQSRSVSKNPSLYGTTRRPSRLFICGRTTNPARRPLLRWTACSLHRRGHRRLAAGRAPRQVAGAHPRPRHP